MQGLLQRGIESDTGISFASTVVQIFVIDAAWTECYFEQMGALVLVLGLCCAGLLALAGLLWVMVRERTDAEAPPTLLSKPGKVVDHKPELVRTIVVHPRMDLASGVVPPNQAVDLDRRRARQMVNASTPWHGKRAVFEPFANRRARPRGRRQRLDLVYAREGMGDLSDPDIRPAGQWKIADLQITVYPE